MRRTVLVAALSTWPIVASAQQGQIPPEYTASAVNDALARLEVDLINERARNAYLQHELDSLRRQLADIQKPEVQK